MTKSKGKLGAAGVPKAIEKSFRRPSETCRCCDRLRELLREVGTEPVRQTPLFKLLGDCDVHLLHTRAVAHLDRLERAAAKGDNAKKIGYAAGYRRALAYLGVIR